MRPALLLAACAAALAACASNPSGEARAVLEQASALAPLPAADYLRRAAASDLYEIQSSQLLLETSQDETLRRFAQMMIEHHTGTTATLSQAARTAGLSPPVPALDAEKRAMIQALQAASGTDRDRLYRNQQVVAHREALELHGAYAQGGDTAALRGAARSATPIVARHFNSLAAMAGQSGHAGH